MSGCDVSVVKYWMLIVLFVMIVEKLRLLWMKFGSIVSGRLMVR